MRIALVGNWPRPYGGVAVHVAALARAARARGLDVTVLDIGRGDHAAEFVRPARGPVRYAAALSAAATEGRLLHVHTNGANVKSWLVALAAAGARRPGGPRPVLTLHSGSAPAFLRRSKANRALALAGTAGFGTVVAVNEEIAAELVAAGVPRAKLAVLAPFSSAVIEAREAPPALATFRARHAPLVAAALAPGPIYGADLLLPAFDVLRAELPGAGLVIFGEGTAGDAFRRPGVLGLGEIDHAAALAVMEASDVFVRPTRADGDAVSVREALALGCCVVASTVGHRPPGCLLFPAGDATSLAGRLVETARAGVARRALPREPREAAASAPPDMNDPFDALFAIYRAHQKRAGSRAGGTVGAAT
jgi:glycogen synthase